MGDISKDFNRSEFACKCGCGFDTINPKVVEMCQDLRDLAGKPIRVNSGCRCPKRNAEAGSHSPNHLHGNAADLSCEIGAEMLWEMSKRLYSAGKMKGLEFSYLENGWLHIDCDRPRNNRFAR